MPGAAPLLRSTDDHALAVPRSQAHCPVCKAGFFSLVPAAADSSLLECRACATWFDPAPHSHTSVQYEQDYYISVSGAATKGYTNYFADMVANRQTFVRRYRRAEKKLGVKGRVLDIGCAIGESLMVAKERGWQECVGVEVSQFCIGKARQRGLEVVHMNDFKKNIPQQHFDVVFMQDVLEHVEDPLEHLKIALQSLRPGGLIFISTPNILSLSRRLMGSAWYHFKAGEHLVYFSPASLKMALLSAGFTQVQVEPGISVMSVGAILQRLERYSRVFSWLKKCAAQLGLDGLPIPLRIGNSDAWAVKKGL